MSQAWETKTADKTEPEQGWTLAVDMHWLSMYTYFNSKVLHRFTISRFSCWIVNCRKQKTGRKGLWKVALLNTYIWAYAKALVISAICKITWKSTDQLLTTAVSTFRNRLHPAGLLTAFWRWSIMEIWRKPCHSKYANFMNKALRMLPSLSRIVLQS